MTSLSIRIDLDSDGRLGPGKVLLLERIAERGSIAAAGRSMAMSYRRAWTLVAEINASFYELLVVAHMGGRQGGGATLTPLGRDLVQRAGPGKWDRRIRWIGRTRTIHVVKAEAVYG